MKSLLLVLVLILNLNAFAGSPQGVPVESTVTCANTNTLLVAANPNRGYLIMQNQGSDATGNCHFKAGSVITGSEGLWVKSGQNYETVDAFTKTAWYCKCDTDAQTVEILQTNW